MEENIIYCLAEIHRHKAIADQGKKKATKYIAEAESSLTNLIRSL